MRLARLYSERRSWRRLGLRCTTRILRSLDRVMNSLFGGAEGSVGWTGWPKLKRVNVRQGWRIFERDVAGVWHSVMAGPRLWVGWVSGASHDGGG